MADEDPYAATGAVIEDTLYDDATAKVQGRTVFRPLVIGEVGGFGSAQLKDEGHAVTYDVGAPLFSAAHPVALGWRAVLRIRAAAVWFNLRIRIGFALVALAERVSPVRPYENNIDDELLR